MTKPVCVLLTQRFAPDSVVAAIRPTLWARGLASADWTVHCITRRYSANPPPEILGLKVHQIGALSPSPISQSAQRRSKRASFVDAWVWPDPSVAFWLRNARQVMRIVSDVNPDIIISTSPPHSIHLLGMLLSARQSAPWVCDFRDPYSDDTRYGLKNKWLTRLHRATEKLIYARAHTVIHAIPTHMSRMESLHAGHASKMKLITNAAYVSPSPGLARGSGKKKPSFIIFSGGVVDTNAIASLALAAAELSPSREIIIKVAGPLPKTLSSNNLSSVKIDFMGLLPHSEYLRQLSNSDALFAALPEGRQNTGLLSSKLFDYLAAGKPAIVIRPTDADKSFFHQWPQLTMLPVPVIAELRHWLLSAMNCPADGYKEAGERFSSLHNPDAKIQQLLGVLNSIVSSLRARADVLSPKITRL